MPNIFSDVMKLGSENEILREAKGTLETVRWVRFILGKLFSETARGWVVSWNNSLFQCLSCHNCPGERNSSFSGPGTTEIHLEGGFSVSGELEKRFYWSVLFLEEKFPLPFSPDMAAEGWLVGGWLAKAKLRNRGGLFLLCSMASIDFHVRKGRYSNQCWLMV